MIFKKYDRSKLIKLACIAKIIKLVVIMLISLPTSLFSQDYKLVWSDEFNASGKPDSAIWSFENGFARNEENQWYTANNAICKDGLLVIEARLEDVINPDYKEGSNDWRNSRDKAVITSSSIRTMGKKEFMYGRLEVRAKIPVAGGAWPAIWTLGSQMEWPSCGEIDIMEYYRIKEVPHILANAAWGSDHQYKAIWNTKAVPFTHFTDKNKDWSSEFHLWRMDWDDQAIKLYLDNELINNIPLSTTSNGKLGGGKNPFMQPHYILLNLAIGGINGGKIDMTAFPMRYEIDYVRLYQK